MLLRPKKEKEATTPNLHLRHTTKEDLSSPPCRCIFLRRSKKEGRLVHPQPALEKEKAWWEVKLELQASMRDPNDHKAAVGHKKLMANSFDKI
jgi:hypothetical protein